MFLYQLKENFNSSNLCPALIPSFIGWFNLYLFCHVMFVMFSSFVLYLCVFSFIKKQIKILLLLLRFIPILRENNFNTLKSLFGRHFAIGNRITSPFIDIHLKNVVV